MFSNTDIRGTLLKRVNANNWKECRDICSSSEWANKGCEVWVHAQKKNCYLKKGNDMNNRIKNKKGVTSGTRVCGQGK